MSDKVSVNAATCKKFLAESGMNVGSATITAFQTFLNKKAREFAAKAAEHAKAKNRKTVMIEDLAVLEVQ